MKWSERPEIKPWAELYTALIQSPAVKHARRLRYRCSTRKCLLLDVIEVPEVGIVTCTSRYKLSDEKSRPYSERIRAANTEDGLRRWEAQVVPMHLSVLRHRDDDGMIAVTCDHVLKQPIAPATFWQHWDAGHTEIRLRPDGSSTVLN